MDHIQPHYQLPNGLIKVRRRWGQRHPQGASSGSNGKLELKLNSKQLPPAHPYPMLANVYQASPFRPAHTSSCPLTYHSPLPHHVQLTLELLADPHTFTNCKGEEVLHDLLFSAASTDP
jgi:hypothetical protein